MNRPPNRRNSSFGFGTLLQRGNLFQVALEQFPERGRIGLDAGDERAFVHLDLDGRAHCSAAERVSKVLV